MQDFNPRSLTGSGTVIPASFSVIHISILVPSRGATCLMRSCRRTNLFQSSLPHGERHGITGLPVQQILFQSSLPHGERQLSSALCYPLTKISILAPSWGATLPDCNSIQIPQDFNPRSLMGSDGLGGVSKTCGKIFQSSLPHGERLLSVVFLNADIGFQSTLPHGERQSRVWMTG